MQKVFKSLQCFAACPPGRIGRSADRQAFREEKKRMARKVAKPPRPPEGRQVKWNHVRLEMIKNQLKAWVNPKAKLHCIKVHSLGD